MKNYSAKTRETAPEESKTGGQAVIEGVMMQHMVKTRFQGSSDINRYPAAGHESS